MIITPLSISGAWTARSEVWKDQRGFFREWFKHDEIFKETKIDFSVMQANFSMSQKGVIRGIHYSLAPEGQSKWVTCVSGSIVDVIVDIRPDSPTFKFVEYVALTPENGMSVLIQSGLGHGFYAQENDSSVAYVLSSEYAPKFEAGLNPWDPELAIQWTRHAENGQDIILSDADRNSPYLADAFKNGLLPKGFST